MKWWLATKGKTEGKDNLMRTVRGRGGGASDLQRTCVPVPLFEITEHLEIRIM